jgi:alkyl hydroperoxide reductase subunit AhpC
MGLRINDTAPDFTALTTHGEMGFHDWLGNDWGVLFSHPKDFTPVCTTELGALAGLEGEFARRGVKVIGLSVDPADDHARWLGDIEDVTGHRPSYPIIADTELAVAKLYDMLPTAAGDSSDGRTAADNQTVRAVFVIDPDKRIRLQLTYPMSTGRNFAELLRVIDSLQLTSGHKVATPADWQQGDDVIIFPAVSNEEAQSLFPGGWDTVKPYLRKVPDPS